MAQSSRLHPSLALGGLFLTLFGAIWLAAADYVRLGASLPALATIMAIAVAAIAMVVWARTTLRAGRLRQGGAGDPGIAKRIRRGFALVNAVQWVAVGLVVLLMNASGHPEWVVPGVIVVTGLHFIPLARLFNFRGYYLTALALVLVAAVSVSAGPASVLAATLFATGAVLWITALALLRALQPSAPGQGAAVPAA